MIKSKALIRAFAFLCLCTLSACGLIFNGSRDGIRVDQGYPPDAQVWYNGVYQGEAPGTLNPDKFCKWERNCQVIIKADGFLPYSIRLYRNLEGSLALMDFLIPLGGSLGLMFVFPDQQCYHYSNGGTTCYTSYDGSIVGTGAIIGCLALGADLITGGLNRPRPKSIRYRLQQDPHWDPARHYNLALNEEVKIVYGPLKGQVGRIKGFLMQEALIQIQANTEIFPADSSRSQTHSIKYPYLQKVSN